MSSCASEGAMLGQQTTHHALERWQQSIESVCGAYETQLAYNRSLFIGEVEARAHAGITLAHLKTNAGLIRRTRRPDREDESNCFLVSQRSGTSQISQNGITFTLVPGDIVLMDSVGSCEITPQGLIEHASFALPRAEVVKVLRSPGTQFGKVSTNHTSGRMLKLLIDQLCLYEEGSTADTSEAGSLLSAFTTLLSPSLCRNANQDMVFESLDSQSLRACVYKLIDESLGQPNLTPLSLATRLEISVRHLYRLFEEQGDSVCRYIQRMRLKRSAADLANPNLRHQSITSIAYKWGFTDSAHFSRSFKKQYEASPKDYRAVSLQALMRLN
ncbi:transcriptional regulator FeaR [Stutzerimonas stutzeri]|nr:transcriptional regulator FeaR [Stutzerimonas stutzeri]